MKRKKNDRTKDQNFSCFSMKNSKLSFNFLYQEFFHGCQLEYQRRNCLCSSGNNKKIKNKIKNSILTYVSRKEVGGFTILNSLSSNKKQSYREKGTAKLTVISGSWLGLDQD
jgi:hypothetical protein